MKESVIMFVLAMSIVTGVCYAASVRPVSNAEQYCQISQKASVCLLMAVR